MRITPQHKKYLADRGVTDESVISDRGYYSADAEELKRLGIAYPKKPTALVIPIYGMPDGQPVGVEVRYDGVQEGRKFDRPVGQPQKLNIAAPLDLIMDETQPLFVVEGATRADALAQRDIAAISITGVYGWRGKPEGGNAPIPLPEWGDIPLRGRTVIFAPDGDFKTKYGVNQAVHAFIGFMTRKGATVQVIDIPGNQGLDDYLGKGGLMKDLKTVPSFQVPKVSKTNVTVTKPSVTDADLALRWIENENLPVRYLWDTGIWVSYDKGVWREDRKGTLTQRHVGKMLRQVAVEYSNEMQGKLDAKAIETTCHVLKSYQKLSNVVGMVRSLEETQTRSEEFDADPWLLNVANGTLDLRTQQLRPHSQKDLLRTMSPTSYDSDAVAPQFHQFLDEILPNKAVQKWVQQYLGSTLVGTSLFHLLPVFVGTGRNGKSVLVDTISSVLGSDYAGALDKTLLVKQKHESHPTKLMALRGKRLMTASETDAGDKIANASIKMLTGGDLITARGIGQDQVTFKPTHSLLLMTNSLPEVDELDKAIWERLQVVRFDTYIPSEKRDTGLKDRLVQQESEGILVWLVEGLRMVLENGSRLGDCPAVSQATTAWQLEENSFLAFMQQTMLRVAGSKVSSAELNERYAEWAKVNGVESPLTPRALGLAMRQQGAVRSDDKSSRGWGGFAWVGDTCGVSGDTSSELSVTPIVAAHDGCGDTCDTCDTYLGGLGYIEKVCTSISVIGADPENADKCLQVSPEASTSNDGVSSSVAEGDSICLQVSQVSPSPTGGDISTESESSRAVKQLEDNEDFLSQF